MDRETYEKTHYVGKHEQKDYNVWRVLGPAGPEERFTVHGLAAAKEAVKGCWDWEVTRADGKEINV